VGIGNVPVFGYYTTSAGRLETGAWHRQTWRMGRLVGLLVVVALVFGIYYFSLKRAPVTDAGTATTQAISLTGVRADLLQIAQAERGYMALNTGSSCATLDELISSKSLSMEKPGRDGYRYEISCASQGFTVAARHDPPPANSGVRYPNLSIDQDFQITEIP
jgi:hypothetical protein